jgi:hypothetical protein
MRKGDIHKAEGGGGAELTATLHTVAVGGIVWAGYPVICCRGVFRGCVVLLTPRIGSPSYSHGM